MQKIMFNDHYGLTNAVLTGRKTQTRRIIEGHTYVNPFATSCQGKLRVNEIHKQEEISRYAVGETLAVAQCLKDLGYDANDRSGGAVWGLDHTAAWANKMFVSASQCRNHIRITDIRIQRLQDISDEDCLKEGIIEDCPGVQYSFPTEIGYCGQYPFDTPKAAYAALIDKVSGKGTWDKNPWVFVYDFELVK